MTRDERERHHRLTELLRVASEADPDERERLLESLGEDDRVLAREALEMLADTTDTGSFPLGDGTVAAFRREAAELLAAEPENTPTIPGYTIRRVIGAGGMGAVYEAEQDRPRRRVAIKVLRWPDASADTLRRFRFESEVLGRLKHPSIAQVYEAGTYRSGRDEFPFIAMEFVEGGEPLDAHVRRTRPDRRALARRYIEICRAVQFGHQRGIIHRDLKPGNILVDTSGTPKIIDYGVARTTEHATIRSSIATTPGGLVGTLRYMSPEQCAGDAVDVDARSDVYALGVVLYELFTGRSPYNADPENLPAMARAIGSQDPVRPASVDQTLQGDLEAILLRALEKTPDRRYVSAAALAADLERWLDNRPVEARPITTLYQLRKLAARHRPAAVALGVTGMVLVAATVFSTAMAFRATRAANAEREQRESLADLNGFLAGILTSVTPEVTQSQEVTVREMLADARERIDEELSDRPLLAASVKHQIGSSFLAVGATEDAAAVLSEARAARVDLLGDSVETLATTSRLADATLRSGRFPDAEALFEEAVRMAERLGLRRSDPAGIEAVAGLGVVAARSGDLPRGEALLLEAVASARDAGVGDEQRLSLTNSLAMLRDAQGRYDEAAALAREVADGRLALLGPRHPSTLIARNNLATTLTDAGSYDEAAEIHRSVLDRRSDVLGPAHPATVSSMNNLAIVLSRLGRTDEAGRLTRDVLRIRREALGVEHPDTITAAMNLVTFLDRNDRDEEADRVLGEFFPIVERTLAPEHPIRLYASSKFVLANLRNERFEDAEDAARRSLEALLSTVDESYWEVARFRALLGDALSHLGEAEEADRQLRRGVDGLTETRGADHPWTAWARARLKRHLERHPGRRRDGETAGPGGP